MAIKFIAFIVPMNQLLCKESKFTTVKMCLRRVFRIPNEICGQNFCFVMFWETTGEEERRRRGAGESQISHDDITDRLCQMVKDGKNGRKRKMTNNKR